MDFWICMTIEPALRRICIVSVAKSLDECERNAIERMGDPAYTESVPGMSPSTPKIMLNLRYLSQSLISCALAEIDIVGAECQKLIGVISRIIGQFITEAQADVKRADTAE